MSAPRLLAPTTISGGVPTAGSGTLNTIALWTPDGNTLGNSLLTQSGNIVTNASGAIRALGTTQTSPAFTRHDTTTSGIYFPATNEIGFTISNQHAMFISSGRNVGIGTVSPGAKLDIRGAARLEIADPRFDLVGTYRSFMTQVVDGANAAASYWRLYDLTAAATRIVCDATGNVGIGTASPVAGGLTVYGASNGQVFVQNSSGYTRLLQNGTDFYIDGNVSGSAGNIIFRRASSTLESARINSSGNVGIGTTAPASFITTNSTVLAVGGAGNLGTVRVSNTANFSGNHAEFFAGASNVGIWGSSNCPMLFYTNSVERMRFGSGGTQAQSQAAIGTSSFTGYAALTLVADADVYGVRVGRGAGAQATNTAVGASALNANTSGAGNTAIGASALFAVTTGTNNTMVGYVAGSGVSTGSSNTMIGFATASGGVTTGSDNTVVGAIAGNQITSGANNVCVGSNAGQTQTTASDNTYVGKNAGYFQLGSTNTAVGRSAMTGASGGASTNTASTAVGYLALQNVTSGNANTAIGAEAGNALTSNGENTFIGQQAGYFPTNGENTAVGRVAMRGIAGSSTGSANTALGRAAMYSFTTGIQNTALGRNAGFALSSGNNNVLIGERAAETLTTGSANIVIGRLATTAAATDSNQLVLGSATEFVATNGGATTYYATAGASLGYIQVRLNGANVKIQVFSP